MADEVVQLKKEGPIAWVAMNRDKTLNSFTSELCNGLKEAFADCEKDEDIRVVVLYGNGRAFCAGGDLKTLLGCTDENSTMETISVGGEMTAAIMGSKKPYIAMIHGAAAGAGFNIALACDFICASKKAKFTQAFSSIGLISDCGGNLLLPLAVGVRNAKKLMMLPEMLNGQQAYDMGIVTVLTEPEELREKTAALATRLAKQPPLALANIKMLMNDCEALNRILAQENVIQTKLIMGEDCKEGIKAFFEKRPPVFHGKS